MDQRDRFVFLACVHNLCNIRLIQAKWIHCTSIINKCVNRCRGLLIALLLALPAPASAEEVTVNFTGNIVNSCHLVSTAPITVPFGDVKSGKVASSPQQQAFGDIELSFADCQDNDRITVRFMAKRHPAKPALIAITGRNNQTAAENVGIRLISTNHTPLNIEEPASLTINQDGDNGTSRHVFHAHYERATLDQDIVPGAADGTATLMIQHDL
jgi:type 1 fimbria pilin